MCLRQYNSLHLIIVMLSENARDVVDVDYSNLGKIQGPGLPVRSKHQLTPLGVSTRLRTEASSICSCIHGRLVLNIRNILSTDSYHTLPALCCRPKLLIKKSSATYGRGSTKSRTAMYTAIFDLSPRHPNERRVGMNNLSDIRTKVSALWLLLVPLRRTSCYNDQTSHNICVQDSNVKLIPTCRSLATVTADR